MPRMSPAESEPAHPAPRADQGGQQVPPPEDQGGQQVPPQAHPNGRVEEPPPGFQPGPYPHFNPGPGEVRQVITNRGDSSTWVRHQQPPCRSRGM
eukprot:6984953-Prorocentrum_lima.AAC.1